MGEREHTPDVERLVGLFKQMMRANRPSVAGLALMQRLDLTLPQILSMVHMRRGPQTISALAEQLRLTPGAVSRLIDQLVVKGLVKRAEGEDDRRCKHLTLSAAGSRTLEKLDGEREADLARMLESIPADLRGELASVLERIAARMMEKQPEEAP